MYHISKVSLKYSFIWSFYQQLNLLQCFIIDKPRRFSFQSCQIFTWIRKEIHLWEHKYILFIVFYTCCIFFFIDGEVLEKYRSRLRELLVGVSQRLEMAVESRSRSNLLKNLCNICNTTHFFHSELLLPSSCFLMFVFSLQTLEVYQ